MHEKFVSLAKRLIAKNGRAMTLRKLNRTPADANKPWRGPSEVASTGYEYERPIVGVIVDFTEEELDADQTRRGFMHLIVNAADHVGFDLSKADSLLDGAQVWAVTMDSVLQPGETRIMYSFRVKQ